MGVPGTGNRSKELSETGDAGGGLGIGAVLTSGGGTGIGMTVFTSGGGTGMGIGSAANMGVPQPIRIKHR